MFETPLSEQVARHFLLALARLVKQGLRFDYLRDYRRVEAEQWYSRGQLDVAKQLSQPPGRRHDLNIRHDVFCLVRSEDRFLKSALASVAFWTQEAANWRLSHELLAVLHEVPLSRWPQDGFNCQHRVRLMAHYEPA